VSFLDISVKLEAMEARKLSIAVVCGELLPESLGGAEIHIVEVIRGLAKKGHTVHVFAGNCSNTATLFDNPLVQVHLVNSWKVPNLVSVFYTLSALRVLKKFLKKNPVDLLHAKCAFPYSFITARLRKRFGIPVFVTVQNPLAHREELVLRGAWIPAFLKKRIQKNLDPLVRYGLQNADFLAPVSTYSQERIKPFSARPSVVIPNGVDTALFQPLTQQKEAFTITTTSSLIPRNGLDTLIEAFALFHHSAPGARLLIAGTGPLKKSLQDLAKQRGISESVQFLGVLRHEDVPALLQQSDLFVRPSRAEGFGVSFLEAMACKVPVITCPSGGMTDFIHDQKTGLLVPPDQPEALAKAMLDLRVDPEKRTQIAERAHALVHERYHWEPIVDRVEASYFSMLRNP
jgi:glycosyltransferase involved in cell wall biosynthesis